MFNATAASKLLRRSQEDSKLCQLPAEIRVKILRSLHKAPRPIPSFSELHSKVGEESARESYQENLNLSSQVLQTCQLLYAESLPILYDENTISIRCKQEGNRQEGNRVSVSMFHLYYETRTTLKGLKCYYRETNLEKTIDQNDARFTEAGTEEEPADVEEYTDDSDEETADVEEATYDEGGRLECFEWFDDRRLTRGWKQEKYTKMQPWIKEFTHFRVTAELASPHDAWFIFSSLCDSLRKKTVCIEFLHPSLMPQDWVAGLRCLRAEHVEADHTSSIGFEQFIAETTAPEMDPDILGQYGTLKHFDKKVGGVRFATHYRNDLQEFEDAIFRSDVSNAHAKRDYLKDEAWQWLENWERHHQQEKQDAEKELEDLGPRSSRKKQDTEQELEELGLRPSAKKQNTEQELRKL